MSQSEFSSSAVGAEPMVLKPKGSPLGGCLGVTAVCCIWNGIISIFVWQAVSSFQAGRPEWFLTIFVTPFLIVGILLVVASFYAFLTIFNPRPSLAVNKQQFLLGDTIGLAWNFVGRTGAVRRLRIRLVGEESATYRRGTTTHTDTEVFADITIVDTTVHSQIPEGQAELPIPFKTMHSFAGTSNKVSWSIRIHGEIAFWPDVDQAFPIDIQPPEVSEGAAIAPC